MTWELTLDPALNDAGDTVVLQVAQADDGQSLTGQTNQSQEVTQTATSSDAYIDQVIGGGDPEETIDDAGLEPDESGDPHGRRLLSIEYNLFHEDSLRNETEHGVVLRLSQETIQHGTFSLDARAKYDAVGGDPNDRLGEYFALRQDEFAINENWQMDNVLGDLIARANPLVGQRYRRTLGSSFLRGLYTRDTHEL